MKISVNLEIWAENSDNFDGFDNLFNPENVKQKLAVCTCCV